MHPIVAALVDGRAFFVGVGLVCAAMAVRVRGSLRPGLARTGWWGLGVGVTLVGLSATPLPWWAYGTMALTLLAWVAVTVRGPTGRWPAAIPVCLVWLAAAAWEAGHRLMPPSIDLAGGTLTVFGDSISAGLDGEAIPTWPVLLRRRGAGVVDHSAMGIGVAEAADLAAANAIAPGIVVVEIGGNDLLGGGSADAFAVGLDRLLRRVGGPDRTVYLFELPLPPGFNRWGLAQRRLAARHGARLVPKRILADLLADADLTTDTVHLSAAGQRRLADVVTRLAHGSD